MSKPPEPAPLRFLIKAIPFASVLFAVGSMAAGLLLLLKGDSSLRPVVWGFAAPALAAPVGLGAQFLLVKASKLRYETKEYDEPDESSFL